MNLEKEYEDPQNTNTQVADIRNGGKQVAFKRVIVKEADPNGRY